MRNLLVLLIGGIGLSLQGQTDTLRFEHGAVLYPTADSAHITVYFGVHGPEPPSAQPPILGKQFRRGKDWAFTPTIRFGPGQTYTAYCKEAYLVFRVPVPAAFRRPHVRQIYPTCDTLPANQLKLYVEFNRPMSRIAYPYFTLLNEAGDTLERAFLLDIPELWNTNQNLLTLWIEPGRIKQGLGPNRHLGPVLEVGHSYRLVIKAGIRDSQGIPLPTSVEKRFFVKDADREAPNPGNWETILPRAGSSLPLWLLLPEPLDYGSGKANLTLFDADGVEIPGDWLFGAEEKSIAFHPKLAWRAGRVQLVINRGLEDLAGNRPGRLFDAPVKRAKKEAVWERFFLLE